MTPAHVPPFGSERIVLIEKMVLAFVVNEPVRIVGPVPGRREMILQPERSIEGSLWRFGGDEAESARQQEQCFSHEPDSPTTPSLLRASTPVLRRSGSRPAHLRGWRIVQSHTTPSPFASHGEEPPRKRRPIRPYRRHLR